MTLFLIGEFGITNVFPEDEAADGGVGAFEVVVEEVKERTLFEATGPPNRDCEAAAGVDG
jgi:hypothetical protein